MRVTLGVIFLLSLVDASIQLNDQSVLVTIKIRKISKNDLLSPKMQTVQLVRTKTIPKDSLGKRHLAPQLLGKFALR